MNNETDSLKCVQDIKKLLESKKDLENNFYLNDSSDNSLENESYFRRGLQRNESAPKLWLPN